MSISREMNPPVEGAFLTDRGWEIKNVDGTTELLIALRNRGEPKSLTPSTMFIKEIEDEKVVWWTNGEINIRDTTSPGKGFKKGMTRKKK